MTNLVGIAGWARRSLGNPRRWLVLAGSLAALSVPLSAPLAASVHHHHHHQGATVLVTGLQGGAGSTVGPDGALYVTENLAGRVSRVDPRTGEVTTFAHELPPALIGIGGATDIVFVRGKAYVLVSVVGNPFGGGIDGIYRVDGPSTFTVIADLGAFSASNPPSTAFDLPNGVQYALETYHGGFLVTDGHHNRVLRVTLDGEVTQLRQFDNIVPTGLEVQGDTIYMAEAGPTPHDPATGKVVSFRPRSDSVTEVASGAPLLVDVERGRGRTLYALAQGVWDGVGPGTPAEPDTGSIVEVGHHGTFRTIESGLDRPTSFEIIGNTAYVITLDGEIWKVSNLSAPPFGKNCR